MYKRQLYNIVDRIFLGHLPDGNTLALTGVGLIFPVVSIVAAFTSLYSSGGAPIFAMARGRKDEERALQIQGTVFALLLGSSLALTVLCYLLKRPLLFLFGASEDSFVFADAYLKIYLLGTPFTMLATGMNPFINAQEMCIRDRRGTRRSCPARRRAAAASAARR